MNPEHSSKSPVYSKIVDEILITAFTFSTSGHALLINYRPFFELTCAYKIVEVSETMCTDICCRLSTVRGKEGKLKLLFISIFR